MRRFYSILQVWIKSNGLPEEHFRFTIRDELVYWSNVTGIVRSQPAATPLGTAFDVFKEETEARLKELN